MKTGFYGIAHLAVDLCSAAYLFRLFPVEDWLIAILLYNFCAFALQLPFGILADRLDRNGIVAAGGMLLVASAFLIKSPGLLGAAIAGCGNALFHVGAGIEILNKSVHRAFRLGLFVAPGALGLFLGTLLGKSGLPLWLLPMVLTVTGGALLLLRHASSGNAPPRLPPLKPGLFALFGVVILRSYLGFCMVFNWNNSTLTALALVSATVLGKGAGGWMLDRFGYLPTALCSLLAAAFLLLKPEWMLAGLLGVFFFQMTMPVTLWSAARCCADAKGFSFGLLTFGLFLGFLPILLGYILPPDGILLAAGILLSLALLLLGRRCAQ